MVTRGTTTTGITTGSTHAWALATKMTSIVTHGTTNNTFVSFRSPTAMVTRGTTITGTTTGNTHAWAVATDMTSLVTTAMVPLE